MNEKTNYRWVNTIATITGLNGMAGGISSFLINIGTGFFLTHIARSAGGFSFHEL